LKYEIQNIKLLQKKQEKKIRNQKNKYQIRKNNTKPISIKAWNKKQIKHLQKV
jgi:hypothetical protein